MHHTCSIYYENGGSGACKKYGKLRHIHIAETDDQVKLKKGE